MKGEKKLAEKTEEEVKIETGTIKEIKKGVEEISHRLDDIEKNLSHRWSSKFYTICEKYDTPYLLMGDVLLEENDTNISEKIS